MRDLHEFGCDLLTSRSTCALSSTTRSTAGSTPEEFVELAAEAEELPRASWRVPCVLSYRAKPSQWHACPRLRDPGGERRHY